LLRVIDRFPVGDQSVADVNRDGRIDSTDLTMLKFRHFEINSSQNPIFLYNFIKLFIYKFMLSKHFYLFFELFIQFRYKNGTCSM